MYKDAIDVILKSDTILHLDYLIFLKRLKLIFHN